MCGRYALSLRPGEVRRQLQESQMPADEAPDDEDVRQTYNFAPGSYGLVYRADVPDQGAGHTQQDEQQHDGETAAGEEAAQDVPPSQEKEKSSQETRYKLQVMKWGLIPFWTKRSPDYGSMMKTINCRDDSLIENRGMWNTMKQRKRCIVVAQGFYEWLKKGDGKTKIPHFTKRKDGQLMCFAGLWDCVKYEGSDDKLYTYSIITTDSNKQLRFLHDRMPVILDNGSDDIKKWLDPSRSQWSKDLQSLLRPYEGELECYPVSKDVGKVGNNSPSFIVPIDSAENKNNIANFFGNHKKAAAGKEEKKSIVKAEDDVKQESNETRATTNVESTEDNAPLPNSFDEDTKGVKRSHSIEIADDSPRSESAPNSKARKTGEDVSRSMHTSPQKGNTAKGRTRSATSNGSAAKSPKNTAKSGAGSQKITAFFGK